MMQVQDPIVKARELRMTRADRRKSIFSMRCVSTQATCRRGAMSQKKMIKFFVTVRQPCHYNGWCQHRQEGPPPIQQSRTSRRQALLFMMMGQCRGLQMATQWSKDITATRINSTVPRKKQKYVWVMQPAKDIYFFLSQEAGQQLWGNNSGV